MPSEAYGADQLLSAICYFIERMSAVNFSLSAEIRSDWQELILKCIIIPNEQVQFAAAKAFGSFTTAYGINERVIQRLTDINAVQPIPSRRAIPLSIGFLDAHVSKSYRQEWMTLLLSGAFIEKVAQISFHHITIK